LPAAPPHAGARRARTHPAPDRRAPGSARGLRPGAAGRMDLRPAGQAMSDTGGTAAAALVARLESLAERARRNPRALSRAERRELPVVYRQVSAVLAEARARGASGDLLARVERVMIAAVGTL